MKTVHYYAVRAFGCNWAKPRFINCYCCFISGDSSRHRMSVNTRYSTIQFSEKHLICSCDQITGSPPKYCRPKLHDDARSCRSTFCSYSKESTMRFVYGISLESLFKVFFPHKYCAFSPLKLSNPLCVIFKIFLWIFFLGNKTNIRLDHNREILRYALSQSSYSWPTTRKYIVLHSKKLS